MAGAKATFEACGLRRVERHADVRPCHVVLPFENLAMGVEPSNRSAIGKRSEEHTSELQSLMRISYAVYCLKKKTIQARSVIRIKYGRAQLCRTATTHTLVGTKLNANSQNLYETRT